MKFIAGQLPFYVLEQFRDREKDLKQTVERKFVPSNPRDNYQTAN